MFNILEEVGAKLHMRPMAVTQVTIFVKCVNEINYLILGGHVIELKKFVHSWNNNFLEGAQNRTNIWFALYQQCSLNNMDVGHDSLFRLLGLCVCSLLCLQCHSGQSLPSSSTTESQKPKSQKLLSF
jgi:hypothetical protein